MRTLLRYAVILAVLAGIAFLFSHYELHGLDKLELRPRTTALSTPGDRTLVPVPSADGTLTIASFNIQVFGQSKLKNPQVMQVLAEIVRRFDVVAIQEIRSKEQDVLPRFIELINANGAHYKYVISPRLGRTSSKEQYAFVYDTATVEVDPRTYVVGDPDDLLHREPFVATFRARGPPPEAAFTFTLVDIHTDPDETDQELNALDDVLWQVRNDGRGEDDVIILGDLNVDEHHLGELGRISHVAWAISGIPTNTAGTATYDNLVFLSNATTEYTGRSGVLDVMSEFHLSRDEVQRVSDHLPVWAEFSVYEGGAAGPVASSPSGKLR